MIDNNISVTNDGVSALDGCNDCSLSSLCLPVAVEVGELERLEEIIKRSKPLRKGEHLFRSNDPFTSVYAVKSGCVKTYSLDETGDEQITGFYFPGELLGTDGISANTHYNSAKALDTSAICEIPFHKLEDLSVQIPTLQRHFFSLMSKEIQNDKQLHMLLSKKPAEERLASFLLAISARHESRKLSANVFRLPMSRGEIGNYLGLTVETISRIFSRFQKTAILKVEGREIEILDRHTLCNVGNK
jgi:CRP/FNR family transcriptional regulator